MAGDQLTVGIIGTGGVSRAHARGIRDRSPGVRLVAANDSDPQALASFCEEFPGLAQHADYRELLHDPGVDAVIVCLPHDLHVACCTAAFAAGKHVLVEKPIARTLKEADAIISAARSAERTLMIGLNQRFMEAYRTVKRLIDAGTFGRLLSVAIDHHQNFDRPPGAWWRSRERVGGGSVIGSGIHRLDLLNWYLGEPAETFAYGVAEPGRLEAEAVCAAVIRYRSGAVASFYINWAVAKGPRSRTSYGEGLSVFGTDASLYVEDPQTLTIARRVQPKSSIDHEAISAEPLRESMWEHFARCIREGDTPLTGAEVGRSSLELVVAIHRAMESGSPVRLPLPPGGY